MAKSMTGYGRGSLHSEVGHFTLEIHSVNRKFLDITVQLPKELVRFEGQIRKVITSRISRGQVTVKLYASFDEIIPITAHPNLALAKQLKQAWEAIAKELGVSTDQFDLSLLSSEEDLIVYEENLNDESKYKEALDKTLEIALQGILEMKSKEGAVLQTDILQRIAKIRGLLEKIEEKAPAAPSRFREKLMARLEELLPGNSENEDRILREVALLAEKLDISEEITRLSYHLTHAEELLESNDSVGKELEFVLQEMFREINTIGSKCQDKEISRYVIESKSELEKIREQIQNVE